MATYQTKKCPSCGMAYETNVYAGHPSKDNRTKYGSPLKQCQHCGTLFIDEEYREIEIEGIREVDSERVSSRTIFEAIIFGVLGIVVVSEELQYGILFILVAVGLVVFELLGYQKRQEKLQREAELSRLRMLHPEYARALHSCGLPVPDKYLVQETNDDATRRGE